MKRAGEATFARISDLLGELRARPALRERKPGVFTLRSRPFLHFHDDPGGIFADVRLGESFVRMPVTTAAEQMELLGRIDDCLEAAEARPAGRRRERGRRDRSPRR